MYQCISGQDIRIYCNPQEHTDLIVAVIGESLAVPHQYQKEIEQKIMFAKALKKAIPQKTDAL